MSKENSSTEGLKHASLFSGIGGFDLAADWMGWENIFHCEINPFGQKILKYYWPNSVCYDDIKKTDFTQYRGSIDVLSGGFPCQPYSLAGQRKGTEDDRHLWPEMLRAIREIRPRWIVGENVFGLVNWSDGLVFDEVQANLEAEGYTVWPYVLPACAVNAPHRRDRIWFVAYSSSLGRIERRSTSTRKKQNEAVGANIQFEFKRFSKKRATTDAASEGRKKREQVRGRANTTEVKAGLEFRDKRLSNDGDATNANSRRQPSQEHGQTESRRATEKSIPNEWENFPTVSPVCSRDDGLSLGLSGITFSKWRNESIKGLGNAVVPQVVYEIFKTIEEYDTIR